MRLAVRQFFTLHDNLPLDDKEVHWGYKDILKLVGLHMLLVLLLPVPGKLQPVRLRLCDWTALLIVLWAYRHFGFWPSLDYFKLRWSDFNTYFKTGVVWGIVIKALPTILAILTMLLVALFVPLGEVTGNNPLPTMRDFSLEWALTAVNIGLVVPIVEEILYRGLLHALLRKRYGVKKALIFSSLIFGLMHGVGFVMVFAILAGLGLALLYEKTGSLAPCIVAHSVGNLASVVLSIVQVL